MHNKLKIALAAILYFFLVADAQPRVESQFRITRLKYSGGSDWYNDPSEEVNLLMMP